MVARGLKVAFLVSGEGTTLEGLARLAASGELPVEIVLVASDRPHAVALERARRLGLATYSADPHGTDRVAWSGALSAEIERSGAEVVVLAGFLSILPGPFLSRWRGRVVNLHPSLLPKYGGKGLYGDRVHRAVLEAGEKESGATVHLVTEEVDHGPVLAQFRLPLDAKETPASLRAKLHPHEVFLLAEVLRRFADGSIPLPCVASGEAGTPPASS